MRGSCLGETNCKALTEKTLVFWIGGCLWGWYLTGGGRTWRFDQSNTQQFLMLSRNVTKLKMAVFDSMYVGLSPIPFSWEAHLSSTVLQPYL